MAAAITLARAGRRVVVHEAHPTVGFRFGQDLQGLENWTTEEDALQWLRRLGISTEFATLPCRDGTFFDSNGRAYPVRSRLPLFYMVERGPEARSVDAALLAQARGLGVEFLALIGAAVERGQPLFVVHAQVPGELDYAFDYAASQPDVIALEEGS